MNKITDEKIYFAIDERIDRIVEQFELRNEELENRIKELENHNINNIIKRVENIEIIISSSVDGEPCIIKRIEDLAELVDTHTSQINNINEGLSELNTDNFQIRHDFDKLCEHIIDYLKEDKENSKKSNKALRNEAKKLGINLNEGDK